MASRTNHPKPHSNPTAVRDLAIGDIVWAGAAGWLRVEGWTDHPNGRRVVTGRPLSGASGACTLRLEGRCEIRRAVTMRYSYAFEHIHGADMVDADGRSIGYLHRFSSRRDRDAWVRCGAGDPSLPGGRETVPAASKRVQAANRAGAMQWLPVRDQETGAIDPAMGEVAARHPS